MDFIEGVEMGDGAYFNGEHLSSGPALIWGTSASSGDLGEV